jgi:hypothetical protein
MRRYARVNLLAIIGFVVGVAGCGTTQTVQEADSLAAAGIAFADAVPAVLDESFVLSVTAASLVLAQGRADVPAAVRSQQLQSQDALLTERLSILRDLKRHALLLRSYFVALRGISQTDAASGISAETENLVARLADLRPEIAAAQIGGTPVNDLIQPAVDLAVGAYQNAILTRELEARGEAIEREIEVQRAVLAAIRDQMIADRELQIQVEERNPLFFQYFDEGPLPDDWADRRIAALRRVVEVQSYDAAEQAATSLHQSWIAFVENRLDPATLALLLRDVDDMLTLVETLQASR